MPFDPAPLEVTTPTKPPHKYAKVIEVFRTTPYKQLIGEIGDPSKGFCAIGLIFHYDLVGCGVAADYILKYGKSLVVDNNAGMTFAQIADRIEAI